MKESVLTIENLHKSFGDNKILKDLSFSLNKGEILAIIGHSGSGKTTLLKCIDLLTPFDQGKIFLNGQKIIQVKNNIFNASILPHKVRQQIGFVFQEWNLWPNKTIIENIIEGPVQVLKKSKQLAEKDAEALLDKFHLLDKCNNYPQELSGGEKQRVSLCRALAMKPQILLLDEITSALDPKLAIEVLDAMMILKKENIAIIIVTHHVEFAYSFADRIAFLHNGKFIEQGVPSILKNPQTKELKKYLGDLDRL